LLIMTGSTTSGQPKSIAATASIISAAPSAPVFTARGGSVLNGDERDGAGSVDAELVEGLQVRLDTRASAGVGAGDRQRDGDHWHLPKYRKDTSKGISSFRR
jgi:hypothetical protein